MSPGYQPVCVRETHTAWLASRMKGPSLKGKRKKEKNLSTETQNVLLEPALVEEWTVSPGNANGLGHLSDF